MALTDNGESWKRLAEIFSDPEKRKELAKGTPLLNFPIQAANASKVEFKRLAPDKDVMFFEDGAGELETRVSPTLRFLEEPEPPIHWVKSGNHTASCTNDTCPVCAEMERRRNKKEGIVLSTSGNTELEARISSLIIDFETKMDDMCVAAMMAHKGFKPLAEIMAKYGIDVLVIDSFADIENLRGQEMEFISFDECLPVPIDEAERLLPVSPDKKVKNVKNIPKQLPPKEKFCNKWDTKVKRKL